MAETQRMKYLVLKNEDIEKYTGNLFKAALEKAIHSIRYQRSSAGKTVDNTYLIVNTDEPYAGQVADMIEAHERAKGTWDHGDKSLREVMELPIKATGQMMSTELKPCPFCDEEAEYYGEEDMVRVRCSVCGANTSGWWDEPEDAAEDWNRRTPNIDINPDRLQEICKAEYHGRLVVLPCKIGDKIYILTHDAPDGIEETSVNRIVIKNNKIQIDADCKHDEWGKAAWAFKPSDFSKTVFLTKEAAEEAPGRTEE